MRVAVLVWVSEVLTVCLAAWNAKYEILQEVKYDPSELKIHMGSHYLDPWFAGVQINQTTLSNMGLNRKWSLYGSIESTYTYMMKTYQADEYLDNPVSLRLMQCFVLNLVYNPTL